MHIYLCIIYILHTTHYIPPPFQRILYSFFQLYSYLKIYIWFANIYIILIIILIKNLNFPFNNLKSVVCIISEQILIQVLFLINSICATIRYSCYLYALLSSNVRSQSICQIKICSEKQNRKNHIIRIKLLMHICKQSLIAKIE